MNAAYLGGTDMLIRYPKKPFIIWNVPDVERPLIVTEIKSVNTVHMTVI
jgi:hypothetical protein